MKIREPHYFNSYVSHNQSVDHPNGAAMVNIGPLGEALATFDDTKGYQLGAFLISIRKAISQHRRYFCASSNVASFWENADLTLKI